MIEIKHLHKSYTQPDGTKSTVIRDVNLTINDGEVISIIGPSGTGKSTLLRCLNGLEQPDSGEIIFHGKRMGMVFQNFNLFEHLSILDNVTIAPRKLLHLPRQKAEQEGLEFLQQVGMAEKAHAMPSSLSGGQKQRVAIARCLAMHPDCILFDEPTSALDPTMVSEVLSVIRNLSSLSRRSRERGVGEARTIIIITHEMKFAHDISSRVLFLSEGNILEDGTPNQIFHNPQHEETRTFVKRIRKLHLELPQKDSDAYALNTELTSFCMRFGLDRYRFHLQLLLDEILFVLAKDYRPLTVDIAFSEHPDELSISVNAHGATSPLLQDDKNNLSVSVVRGICDNIEETLTPEATLFKANVKA